MNAIVAALHLVGRLPTGRAVGKSIAPLVWLALWSHATWVAVDPEVWVGNDKLAAELGTNVTAVKRGIKLLRDEGLIETRLVRSAYDKTRRFTKLIGRAPAPVVRLPEPAAMHSLWRVCKAQRVPPPKAAGLVAMAVALFVLAAEGPGAEFGRPQVVRVSVKALRAMLACPSGGSFYDRLGALEAAGVVRRAGATWRSGFVVMPAAAWGSLEDQANKRHDSNGHDRGALKAEKHHEEQFERGHSSAPAGLVGPDESENHGHGDPEAVGSGDAVLRPHPAGPRDQHVGTAANLPVLPPPRRPVSIHGRGAGLPEQHLAVARRPGAPPHAAVDFPLGDPPLDGDQLRGAGRLTDEEVDALADSVAVLGFASGERSAVA
jgi:hypothetical protein